MLCTVILILALFGVLRWCPVLCNVMLFCDMNGLCTWPHLFLLVWGVLVLHTTGRCWLIITLPWCMTAGFACDSYAVWNGGLWGNDNSPYTFEHCMRLCSPQWAIGLSETLHGTFGYWGILDYICNSCNTWNYLTHDTCGIYMYVWDYRDTWHPTNPY